jgi:hypothetical protein
MENFYALHINSVLLWTLCCESVRVCLITLEKFLVTYRIFCSEIGYIVVQYTRMSISGDFETTYLSALLCLFMSRYDTVK